MTTSTQGIICNPNAKPSHGEPVYYLTCICRPSWEWPHLNFVDIFGNKELKTRGLLCDAVV